MKKTVPPLNAAEQAEFAAFWAIWPRGIAKLDAQKAWAQTRTERPALAVLLKAVRDATEALNWTSDRAQYIPYPASWLRAQRWTDEHSVKRMTRRVMQLAPQVMAEDARLQAELVANSRHEQQKMIGRIAARARAEGVRPTLVGKSSEAQAIGDLLSKVPGRKIA